MLLACAGARAARWRPQAASAADRSCTSSTHHRRQHRAGERRPEPLRDRPCPQTIGALVAGDTLISNFNNAAAPEGNLQGTGTTIVQLNPRGRLTLFAQLSPLDTSRARAPAGSA